MMFFFGVNYPIREKFQNCVSKEFMTILIHVLCLNFTDIDCWEVGETLRCLADKSSQNAFSRRHLCPLGGGRQKSAGERAT